MPSPTEECREQISLPSFFQMELLFKIKNKKKQLGNTESKSLNFPVACSFNGSSTQEHRYHSNSSKQPCMRGKKTNRK